MHLVAIVVFGISLSFTSLQAAVPVNCSTLPARNFALENSLNKCISCHRLRDMGPVGLEDIDKALCRRSTTLIEGMIKYAFAEPTINFDFDDAQTIRDRQAFLHSEKTQTFAQKSAATSFFSSAKQSEILSLMPKGDLKDPGGLYLENLKKSGMVFYDETVIPKVIQAEDFSSHVMGIQFPTSGVARKDTHSKNYYADRGGLEFPWLKAAGTDLATDIETYKFFVPPASGEMVEVFRVSRTKHRQMYSYFVNETALLHGFSFLPGTVFGEVLITQKPHSNTKYIFEIRLREVDSQGQWFYEVLRPYPTKSFLTKQVKSLYPYWESEPELNGFVSSLEQPQKANSKILDYASFFDSFLLNQNSTALSVFQRMAVVEELESLNEDLMEVLFQKASFRSAMGSQWSEVQDASGKKILGHAGQSRESFSFFPKNYMGSHLKLNSSSCVQCHANTQYYVKNFDPKKGAVGTTDGSLREWYNHMPGSTPQESPYGLPKTGVFSFHPFSTTGMVEKIGGGVYRVNIQSALNQAGLVRETGEVR